MVCVHGNLPLLQLGKYDVGGYDRHWLRTEIRTAARNVGLHNADFADDVAASILGFLEFHWEGMAIDLKEMENRVCDCLRAIGRPEVADSFQLAPPPVHIQLEELAARAGVGFELGFFRLIETRIDSVLTPTVRKIKISGVAKALAVLGNGDCSGEAHYRSIESESQRSEIIHFVEAAIARRASEVTELRITLLT